MHEIIRPDQSLQNGLGGGQGQKQKPEQGGAVAHDAVQKQSAVSGENAPREHQAQMLQVALAPAPIPLEFVQQVGWYFLVASFKIVSQSYGIPGYP